MTRAALAAVSVVCAVACGGSTLQPTARVQEAGVADVSEPVPETGAPDSDSGLDMWYPEASLPVLDAGADEPAPPFPFGGNACPIAREQIHGTPPPASWWSEAGLVCQPGDAGYVVQDPDGGSWAPCIDTAPNCPSGWPCEFYYGSYGYYAHCP